MALRVLLADDSPCMIESLKLLLQAEGFELAGVAADGEAAVRCARALQPDVAILDVSMPRMSGVEAAREIRDACPYVRTIILTAYNGSQLVMAAMQAGARGFVVKSDAADDVARAIRAVGRGDLFISPAATRSVVECCLAGRPGSPRERPADALDDDGRRGDIPAGATVVFQAAPPGFTD